jgi:hypothetical protein
MRTPALAVLIVLVALLTATPTRAEAQTQVLNPRTLSFDPSADHGATLPDGQPAVTRYEVRWFASGAAAPLQVNDLGKPVPVGGRITVDMSTQIGMIPVGAGYVARVAAIGPAGEGVSDPSNPFGRASPPTPATNVTLAR